MVNVRNQVEGQVSHKVNVSIWDQGRNKVIDIVRSQVLEQVQNQIDSQINDQLFYEVGQNIKS